jgi:lysophospholipase L1-like esterase
MKNYKYIGLLLLSIGVASCDVNNELDQIESEVIPEVALNTNGLDFSTYVAIGASYTAGYADGAMFKAAQENSFPNILAGKFGTEFIQPLMNDNIGGLVFGGTAVQPPRFYFDGAGPARLPATPTTELTTVLSGPFHNFGAPGAKSFHLGIAGYGQLNPYFGRMASSPSASILGDALAQNPTFFTLDIGGNDVLGYALSGGSGVDQLGNYDPSTYGSSDITDPNVFASILSATVAALTANGAKGVLMNVPPVKAIPNLTTVPYNPVPLDAGTAGVVNGAYAAYNVGIQQAFAYLVSVSLMTQEMADAEIVKRTISFSAGSNAVVMIDEDLTDLTAINPALISMRQTTADDLLLLAGSAFIGTLADPNNPGSINGVAVPLADKWVLTPEEQMAIQVATDSYNATMAAIAGSNPNIALFDFYNLGIEAVSGIVFDDYTMNGKIVTGGIFSLDGLHATARGYALIANYVLAATDAEFGSNFTTATDGLAKAGDYPTNYSASLR